MNDDDYRRARTNGRIALVLVPICIVTTVFWVVVHPEYQPGDWRGDLAARALFGLIAIGFFAAFGVFAVRRWRDEAYFEGEAARPFESVERRPARVGHPMRSARL